MHPKSLVLLCVLCSFVTGVAGAATEPTDKFQPAADDGIADEYIVVLRDGVARDPLARAAGGSPVGEVARRLAAAYGGTIERTYEYALSGFSVHIDESGAQSLAADPAVRLVEQNAAIDTSTVDNCDPTFAAPNAVAVFDDGTPVSRPVSSPETIACPDPDPVNRPGDPDPADGIECIDNWGLDLIDGARDGAYDFSGTGAGVHVYLLDLGIDLDHPEFAGRIRGGFNAAAPDDAPASVKADVDDCVANSHGTHVAGIVAGSTYGVAKGAWIHPVKFDDVVTNTTANARPECEQRSYHGTRDTLINGIEWILAHHNHDPDHMGPAVVNFSGGNGASAATRDDLMAFWVRRLLSQGITLVQAAGNQDDRPRMVPGQPDVPQNACLNTLAQHPEVREGLIVAGGVDETVQSGGAVYGRWVREIDDPSYGLCGSSADCGSNSGLCADGTPGVDVWAPAAHIVSASNQGGVCRLSGTSMAAPHVTGVVALLLEHFPQASPAAVEKAVVASARSALDVATLRGGPDRLVSTDFPTSGAPIAGDLWLDTPPGTPLVMMIDDLLAGALDWAGDALVLSDIDLDEPAHGQLQLGADRLTYYPDGGFTGFDQFTYTVSDGAGGIDSAVIHVDVSQQPRPPVARPDCYETPAGTDLALGSVTFPSFLENDNDPDGDLQDWAVTDPDHGIVGQLQHPSPTYYYHPDAGFVGTETVHYSLRDSYYQKGEGTITVYVGGGTCPVTNAPPVAQGDSFATSYGTPISFLASSLLANDSDPDGDEIFFAGLAALPDHGELVLDGAGPEDFVYRYVPDSGFVGTDGFDYWIEDEHGESDTGHVTLTVSSAGFGGNSDAFITQVDQFVRILGSQLISNDSPGAVFIRAENAYNGTLVLAGLGPEDTVYDFSPASGFVGTAGFEYLISPDGFEPYTRVAVTVQVVDGAPVAGFTVSCAGTACSFDGSLSSDDVGIASYAWSFGDGASASGITASHSYARGTYLATLTLTDTAGHTATAEKMVLADALPVASFTVSCSDLTCAFDAGASSDDGGIATYAWSFGDGGTGGGVTTSHTYATSGERTATLTVTDTAGQTASTTRPVVIDLPPIACFTASCIGLTCAFDASCANDDIAILSYAWSFGDGATGSGASASHSYASSGARTVTLTVTDARNPGVATTRQVSPDAPPVAAFAWSCVQRSCTFDGSASSDNQPLATYAWVFGDGATGSGATTTHTYAVGGSYAARLTVTDSVGQGGTTLQTIVVNRPPVAIANSASTPRDTPKSVNVLGNDFDPDGDALTVVSWTQGAHGSVSKVLNEKLRYQPATGYTGPDSFTYTITDGRGDMATATVSVTVTVPNDPPEARDDGWSTYIDGQTYIPVSHLLANDYDPNGDSLSISSFGTSGLAGTLDCSSGTSCRYTPSYHFIGTTSFSYTVGDGKGGTDSATVRIKVGTANSYPAPQDDILETTRNTALTFTRATLLANDTDPDGDVLSVTQIFRSPATGLGTVSCSAAYYTCTYTPPAGFTGVDVLTYRASDGIGFTDARIRILVRPSSPPTLDAREDQIFTTTSVTYISYSRLLGNDYDPEGGALTVVSVDTTGLLGTLDCTTWTTGCDYYRGTSSPTRFRYTVRDPQGNLDTTTVTLKPGNWTFNNPPMLSPDQLTTARNTPLQFSIFDLMRNDYDPDNDQLDLLIGWSTPHGTLTCTSPKYLCTYTPNTNFTGVDTITYYGYDGTNNPSTTVTVTVTP